MTLAAVAARARITEPYGALVVQDEGGTDVEVSVAYYRCGYTPADYPGEAEWSAREAIEKSSAIKCPSVAYHLAGTKRVQQAGVCVGPCPLAAFSPARAQVFSSFSQALAGAGVLERFVSRETAALLRRSFAGLWSLDPAERDASSVSCRHED